jgi:hypothetical protein
MFDKGVYQGFVMSRQYQKDLEDRMYEELVDHTNNIDQLGGKHGSSKPNEGLSIYHKSHFLTSSSVD